MTQVTSASQRLAPLFGEIITDTSVARAAGHHPGLTEARVDGIKARLTELRNTPTRMFNCTAAQLRRAIDDLEVQLFTVLS